MPKDFCCFHERHCTVSPTNHASVRHTKRMHQSFNRTFLLVMTAILAAAEAPKVRNFDKLPIVFEPNQGQADAQVKFIAHGAGYTLYLTDREAVMSLKGAAPVRMSLVGGAKPKAFQPSEATGGVSNYFLGNDPAKWRTGIPNFRRLKFTEVYPGVDMVYYGDGGKLEYDLVVAPGADARRIEIAYQGVERIRLDERGDLLLKTKTGEVRQQRPVVYQQLAGKRVEVAAAYRLLGDRKVGFELARYDRSKSVVIDPALVVGPVLMYSTYLGGSNTDFGYAIAVDQVGNAYVTGTTESTDFPLTNAYQSSGDTTYGNAFVTKINASGSAKIYSTYLGGSSFDQGLAIAADSSGNAYVAGWTSSTNFPTMIPLQPTIGGANDAFVTKLNPSGSALIYSTYLGGSSNDEAAGIAVDGSGNAYIVGQTASTNFPTTNPLQATLAGGVNDAFVTEINAGGTAKVYSTYLGGSGQDYGAGIAVDTSGNAYIAGFTTSTDFPTTNPLQPTPGGPAAGYDAFITKINAGGASKAYSTYLGGSGNDYAYAIAVDGSGNAYVAGQTVSTDFPTTNPFQAANGGGNSDAFVAEINASGSAKIYATYLGGSNLDSASAIAVDANGNAYVAGWTNSANFPTANALQGTYGGGAFDAFVTKIDAGGSAKLYSTYFGGTALDQANGICLDQGGNVYFVGTTVSTDFPTSHPLQPASGGGGDDVFISSLASNTPSAVFRDTFGGIQLLTILSTTPQNSHGVFASDPAVAHDLAGNTFVAARDNFNALYVNVFTAQTQTWAGWVFAGGAVQGVPSIAVTPTGTAYFVARDAYNSYWINSYTPGTGFGGYQNLGGIFSTDPVIAVGSSCPGGVCTLYLVGKDNYNAIWTGLYLSPGGFAGWQFQGAVVGGKPSVTVGVDGAAYIAVQDLYSAVWMGRQAGSTFNLWQPGHGTIAVDPQVAGADGKIFAVSLTSSGAVWYNTFTEGTGNNWLGWQSNGGTLTSISAATGPGPQLFITGKDPNNKLWWFETPGAGWRFFNNIGVAAGPLVAAPR
jgi:hypothetical protein